MTRGLTPTLTHSIQIGLSLRKARQPKLTLVVCALDSAGGLFHFLGSIATRISDTNVSEYVQVPSGIVHQDSNEK
jgi:hypothetical protein